MNSQLSNAVPHARRVLAVVRWPLGGIRTYILYNYRILGQAGYRFTFVGPDDAAFEALRQESSAWEGAEFVPVAARGEKCRLWPAVRRLLGEGRFHLVHSQGLTAAVHAVVGNYGLGVPHVITSHQVILDTEYPGWPGLAKRWMIARLLRRADVLVAATNDARQNLLDFFPGLARGRCRLITVPHGVDTKQFEPCASPPAGELRQRWDVGPEEFLIGFFGRFMEQKGFLVLVDALDKLLAEGAPRPFRLLAVGSNDCIRRYQTEVARRHLQRHILFIDHVPAIAPLLRQIDLAVMPSLWEACGLVAMEAMAAEVPLIGTDCIGLREVLRGTPSMMVRAGDSLDLARALRTAMTDPWTEQARRFGPAARQRFDIERSAHALLAIFDECARPRAAEEAAISEVPKSSEASACL